MQRREDEIGAVTADWMPQDVPDDRAEVEVVSRAPFASPPGEVACSW